MKTRLFIALVFAFLSFFSSGSYAGGGLRSSQSEISLYYAVPKSGEKESVLINLGTTTKGGIFHGVWDLTKRDGDGNLPNVSWDGNAAGYQVLRLKYVTEVKNTAGCSGLDLSRWSCNRVTIHIEVPWDKASTCPWILMFISRSTNTVTGEGWSSTMERTTACVFTPTSGLDISWDPKILQHDKQITFNSTGGEMESTLHTYLWEGGSVCDNSLMDDRGANCRVITTGISVTALGCDNSKLTTYTVRHPLSDMIIHDIIVKINTENIGAGQFTSTCNYRYIIDQL
ncbi:StfH/YfcO family fimbrial adhesin [Enterobacter chuandaensis]|uniref:StfH/YfcO family fimbrial adhesin n=1 Tax=Enterobacter TaxID=547 RepID=UPI002930790E|nr:StfH/YfcO family fimbrial adhesin [Enterobacter sp. 296B2]